MYKGKKILCVIPARGGSKGLPGKNIKPLLGKPLIAWSIKQGLESKYLDKVMVNTDDAQIAAISKKHGAAVPFMRPAELAKDNSKVIDAISHIFKTLEANGEHYDYLALLEPTSPLRKKGDIDKAIKILIDNEKRANSVISVGEIALEHPIYAKTIDSKGYVKSYVNLGKSNALRQEIPPAYFPYGVIYLSKITAIKKFGMVYPGKILPLVIERWQNYEINDIIDFKCVDAIMKEMKKKIA